LRLRNAGHQRFALSGTPTDCVMMAGIHLMKDHLPDLVLSGVNRGFNVADDVTYSGTVAAAMEARAWNSVDRAEPGVGGATKAKRSGP